MKRNEAKITELLMFGIELQAHKRQTIKNEEKQKALLKGTLDVEG